MADVLAPKVPHFLYGGDYNPEQWPEETWVEDARLMREAGVNLVTLGVFSWSLLEPQPGRYDFGWMDRVIELLASNGILVDLATATASPPPWLAARHPETLPVTRDGTSLWPGSRQHYCPSSTIYRDAAASLVRKLAERYADHPSVAMWHINNEYGCHVPACYCDTSAAAFREWLRERYGTIEELNAAWNTRFWSQLYARWEEIFPPRTTPTFVNPGQELDYWRFSDHELLACYEQERAILRDVSPALPITTNFMGFFKPCDYWRWAEREDVVSNDNYPDPASPETPSAAAMTCDLMRSLAGGGWLLMEQAATSVQWRRRNAPKRPGQMRLLSYQAVARGAEGIMFFQWRQSKGGSEKFHSAMVPHAEPSRSRAFNEVATLGNELARLDDVLGSRCQPEAAIAFDWESWWALELPSKPSWDIPALEQVKGYHRPLFEANVPVDFVHPAADLSRYRLLLVPNLYMVTDDVARDLERFVADGGVLVMSFFSGIVDERDQIRLGGYPQPFRELLGIHVGEFSPLMEGETHDVRFADGRTCSCDLWSEPIDLEGAEAIATYAASWLRGRPAVTRNRFGQGTAYYLGTRLDGDGMASLLRRVVEETGLEPTLRVPVGIEAVRREGSSGSYLFVLNHNGQTVQVTLDGPYTDKLTGEKVESLSLEPYGVAVLER